MNELIEVQKESIPYLVESNANRLQIVRTAILEGEVDPIKAYAVLNELKKQVESIQKDKAVKNACENEYHNYPEKTVYIEGYGFSIREGSAILDYESDPVYAELKEKLAARKQLLDTVTKTKTPVADPETGEMINPLKVKTYRADSFTITKKK